MKRNAAGDFDGLGEVPVLAVDLLVEGMEVEEEGEGSGGGWEEDVGGGVEFGGNVEGVGGEEVDDEGCECVGGGERMEGLAEGGEGAEDDVGHEGFDLGVMREVGEIDLREEGVGDGVGKGLEDGDLGLGRWTVGGDDEGDGEVVVADDSLGELNHRD